MKLRQRCRDVRGYRRLAGLLNDLPVDPDMQPSYDAMSGGLIWRDEVPLDRPPHEWLEIRSLWHHRTSLIMGEPSGYACHWKLGLRCFPRWPGFLPERRECRDEYRSQIIEMRAHWEAALDDDDFWNRLLPGAETGG